MMPTIVSCTDMKIQCLFSYNHHINIFWPNFTKTSKLICNYNQYGLQLSHCLIKEKKIMAFALKTISYSDYNVKKFSNMVKTVSWAKKHRATLLNLADNLTSVGNDTIATITRILQSGFGDNIGTQIAQNLTPIDFDKIKRNIINLY